MTTATVAELRIKEKSEWEMDCHAFVWFGVVRQWQRWVEFLHRTWHFLFDKSRPLFVVPLGNWAIHLCFRRVASIEFMKSYWNGGQQRRRDGWVESSLLTPIAKQTDQKRKQKWRWWERVRDFLFLSQYKRITRDARKVGCCFVKIYRNDSLTVNIEFYL